MMMMLMIMVIIVHDADHHNFDMKPVESVELGWVAAPGESLYIFFFFTSSGNISIGPFLAFFLPIYISSPFLVLSFPFYRTHVLPVL